MIPYPEWPGRKRLNRLHGLESRVVPGRTAVQTIGAG